MPSRSSKSFIIWLCAGLLLLVILFLLRAYAVAPYIPGNDLVVTASGDAQQKGKTVARVRLNGTEQLLKISLVTPQNSLTTVDTQLQVTFPSDEAQTLLSLEPISIQGTEGVQSGWIDGHTLLVTLSGLSPESYTILAIHAPGDYFHIPWYRAGIAHLENLPFTTWALFSLAILLLTSLVAYWKTRLARWRAEGEQYSVPAGLNPLEMAILHHSSIRPIDVVAFIYYLAERGYVQIVENETGVLFVRTKKTDALQNYERDFMVVLLGNQQAAARLSDILQGLNQELFSAVVSQLYVEIYDSFNAKGYFRDNPRFIHLRYKTAGILLQFLGLLLAIGTYMFLRQQLPYLLMVGLALYMSGLMVYAIGYHVVPLAKAAQPLLEECGRLRNYLNSRELIGPEGEQGNLFFTLVPFALAIDVSDRWWRRFEGIRWYIPSWYECADVALVAPEIFLQKVAVLADQLAEAMNEVKDPNVD